MKKRTLSRKVSEKWVLFFLIDVIVLNISDPILYKNKNEKGKKNIPRKNIYIYIFKKMVNNAKIRNPHTIQLKKVSKQKYKESSLFWLYSVSCTLALLEEREIERGKGGVFVVLMVIMC
ncbi:hypothetical protein LguiB_018525 [Lonicera macranthoides]